MKGGSDVLGLMNLIAFILLFAVTVYVIVEINKLKEYDENNEKQLTNLVSDINYNNYVISKNNDKITNLN
jgi:glucose uptake protein GlcU|tara:strand:- start:570 stop:779 length:210 start_codon:yes stop_codon:yes gene_type:complete